VTESSEAYELSDVVETAVARALVLAAEAKRWDVVMQIAGELHREDGGHVREEDHEAGRRTARSQRPRSAFARAGCPARSAQSAAVRALESRASTLAPRARSSATAASWPKAAATMSGVAPAVS
jgi:hypothetical protein